MSVLIEPMGETTLLTQDGGSTFPLRDRHYGLAALGGGLINIGLGVIPTTGTVYDGTWVLVVTMYVQVLATTLMLVGLYGLHRWSGDRYGRVGRAIAGVYGFGLASVTAAAAILGIATMFDYSGSTLQAIWLVMIVVTTLFASLYGVVLWRVDVLRPAVIVMIATVPMFLLSVIVLGVFFDDVGGAFTLPLGIAWVTVGYAMHRDHDTLQR